MWLTALIVSSGLSGARPSIGTSSPSTRTSGGPPAFRCRSEPPAETRWRRAASTSNTSCASGVLIVVLSFGSLLRTHLRARAPPNYENRGQQPGDHDAQDDEQHGRGAPAALVAALVRRRG